MTVHGSKGLEFEAVHLPGLTQASFPSSYHGQRCPPPVGLIAGAEGLSVSEEAKQSHEHGGGMPVFRRDVARTQLSAVLSARRSREWPTSARLPNCWQEFPCTSFARLQIRRLSPCRPMHPGSRRSRVTHAPDWNVTDRRLELYQNCPRRFFYTHVLGLGAARKTTAFSRTHDCLVRGYPLASLKPASEAEPGIADAEAAFDTIWQARGPKDHAFAPDYRQARLAPGQGSRQVRRRPPFPQGRAACDRLRRMVA